MVTFNSSAILSTSTYKNRNFQNHGASHFFGLWLSELLCLPALSSGIFIFDFGPSFVGAVISVVKAYWIDPRIDGFQGQIEKVVDSIKTQTIIFQTLFSLFRVCFVNMDDEAHVDGRIIVSESDTSDEDDLQNQDETQKMMKNERRNSTPGIQPSPMAKANIFSKYVSFWWVVFQ